MLILNFPQLIGLIQWYVAVAATWEVCALWLWHFPGIHKCFRLGIKVLSWYSQNGKLLHTPSFPTSTTRSVSLFSPSLSWNKAKMESYILGHLNSLPYLSKNFNKSILLNDNESKNCQISGKQSRSDAAIWGVRFGSALFDQVCQSKYLE